jgi:hypothetical protein
MTMTRAAAFTLAMLGTVAALLGVTGCSSSSCTDNQNSLPLAGFYVMDVATDGTIAPAAVSISGISINGIDAPNDSLLYGESDSESQVYLPFRFDRNSTAYRFYVYDSDVADTITFHYDTYPFFASEECGAMYRYQITAVEHTSAFIDSVAVTDSLITNVDLERIQIFIKHNEDNDSDSSDSSDNSDSSDSSDSQP